MKKHLLAAAISALALAAPIAPRADEPNKPIPVPSLLDLAKQRENASLQDKAKQQERADEARREMDTCYDNSSNNNDKALDKAQSSADLRALEHWNPYTVVEECYTAAKQKYGATPELRFHLISREEEMCFNEDFVTLPFTTDPEGKKPPIDPVSDCLSATMKKYGGRRQAPQSLSHPPIRGACRQNLSPPMR